MATLSFDAAAHLLRRMGFGGSPEEIEALAARGREGAVDSLINYNQLDNAALDTLIQRSFNFINPDDFVNFNRVELQRWWFTRMVHTRRPFEEKMTLFWHNHFATSDSKVDDRFMYVQNLKLRAQALDRFDTLLLAVAQDPAMLLWLDGIANVKNSPNENWARELQELFTMGINDVVTGQPNYTEHDVKEIARAFTGWKFFLNRADATRNPFNFQFFINPPDHDESSKTIYGQTANFSGEDVISLLAAKRTTGRYLVKKLFEFFVYPLDLTSATDKATIDKFADVYMATNHSIKELVRAIFVSDEFFSERASFALVKSPVEFIVGAIRMTGAKYNTGNNSRENASYTPVQFSYLLGQELFNPPDVAGWDSGLGWINTSWLLNRFTYADALAITRTTAPNVEGLFILHEQLKKYTKASAKKTVRNFLSLLGPLTVDNKTVKILRDYLQTNDSGAFVEFTGDDNAIDKKVRGMLHLIMCLSEFQLN
jgi:uncharacterized protein (DUF1800 family)